MAEKKKTVKKVISWIILIICICVFCYAGYNLFTVYYANHQEGQEIERLQEVVQIPDSDDPDRLEVFNVDFAKLQEINPGVVGWIVVEDTSISYPIVQGSDNDYYLTHTFEKQSNYAGAIFMDYRATPDFSDLNTFIYGHNVFHGTMFAELANYVDKAYFDSHPYIYLYTPSGNYKLEVFSAYVDIGDSDSYQMSFATQESYASYLQLIQQKSRHQRGTTVSAEDNIVTLFTCSYESGNNPFNTQAEYIEDRYFIHAKIIAELEPTQP